MKGQNPSTKNQSLVPTPLSSCFSLFSNILVPNLRVRGDVAFEQLAARAVVEIDHFDAVLAKPVDASLKRAALAHHNRSDAKLPHQAAAVPAGRKRRYHHQVAITALASGAAK